MKALTKADVDQLPNGTPIKVRWSGGNGPWSYILQRHYSTPWACTKDGHWVAHLNHVGSDPLDQVWIDVEGEEAK